MLGKQKFSSNVIEKIFEHSDDVTKDILVEKLSDPSIIKSLLFDMYGNYVIQKAMSFAREPYYSRYISTIIPLVDKLKLVSFGPKLYHKLLNTYKEISYHVTQKHNHKYNMNFQADSIPFKRALNNITSNDNNKEPFKRNNSQQINSFFMNHN